MSGGAPAGAERVSCREVVLADTAENYPQLLMMAAESMRRQVQRETEGRQVITRQFYVTYEEVVWPLEEEEPA